MSNTKATILLVEDDSFTGRLMEIQFRKNNFEIALASCGEEALQFLQTKAFDLVLSDVHMPGINGLELLDKIRENYSREDLPVVLLTALGDASSILDGFQRGASDFLVKTNEFGIILAKVQLHLEFKRLAQLTQVQGPTTLPSLARASADALWNWDLAQNKLNFSKAMRAIFDLDATAQPSLELWLSHIQPEDRGGFQASLDAHLARKGPHFETTYRLASSDRFAHSFGVASFAQDGKPVRMVGCTYALEAGELIHARNLDRLRAKAAELGLTPDLISSLVAIFNDPA